MRPAIIFILCMVFLHARADDAPKSFLVSLRGSAAMCAFTGSSEATSAFLVGRDNGTNSKKYKAAIAQSYAKAKACVDEGKPKMKPLLKAEVEARPEIREFTLDAYAKWISYMDWLSTPHDWATGSREEAAFEQAANRLQAEMDIR